MRYPDVALHKLENRLRERKVLCLISHHLSSQLVLHHELREVPYHLRRRCHLRQQLHTQLLASKVSLHNTDLVEWLRAFITEYRYRADKSIKFVR